MVYYFNLFMNRIRMIDSILFTLTPAIQKPPVDMLVSIQHNLQFGDEFMVLYTGTTV